MGEPKIILFDLETLPDMTEAMRVWPQLSNYPGLTLRASITSIICAGYKIYGEDKVHCINAWDFSRWDRDINDDYSVCREIYEILKDADAVITHNGKRFDWKYLQTRLMKHGLGPLPKIPHIDTKETAKRHLFVFNNRLGTVGDFLVDEKKLDHDGWDLWVGVSEKNKKSMKTMTDYCIQDVLLLEKIFVKLKPLISNIPNYNLFGVHSNDLCPACGSTRHKGHGWRRTATRSYQRRYCIDCNSTFRMDASNKNPRAI